MKCYCIVVLPLMLLFITSDVSLISWVCDLQFPSRRFWNFCLSFLVYSVSECSSFPVLFGPWIHIHWFILSFSKYLLEVYCVPGCIPHTLIWDLWSFLSFGKLLVIFSNIFSSFFFFFWEFYYMDSVTSNVSSLIFSFKKKIPLWCLLQLSSAWSSSSLTHSSGFSFYCLCNL